MMWQGLKLALARSHQYSHLQEQTAGRTFDAFVADEVLDAPELVAELRQGGFDLVDVCTHKLFRTMLCRAELQASAVVMSHTSRLAASNPDCLPLRHTKHACAAAAAAASTLLALPDLQETHFWRLLS